MGKLALSVAIGDYDRAPDGKGLGQIMLLSPARGRGWVRGLQTIFEAPSPSLSPSGGEEHEVWPQ